MKANEEKTDNHRINEYDTGHKGVDLKVANEVGKSVCKITIKVGEGYLYGTGFFMKLSKSLRCLVTNYHVINPNMANKDIEIEIWNEKKMKLNLSNRKIKYIKEPKDVTLIIITKTDVIFDDIKFLNYDLNYSKGYDIYENAEIFLIGHPLGKGAKCASGTIQKIIDFEFDHNISTDTGSSGSPILLQTDNIKLIQVIGIHKNGDKKKKINLRCCFCGIHRGCAR